MIDHGKGQKIKTAVDQIKDNSIWRELAVQSKFLNVGLWNLLPNKIDILNEGRHNCPHDANGELR